MRYLLLFMGLFGLVLLTTRNCTWHFGGPGVQGEGPVRTETRQLGEFSGIDLGLAGDIEVSIADSYSVEVSAQENLLPLLKTELRDGVLHLFFEGNVSYSENVKIRIAGPSFNRFEITGSGKITLLSPMKNERLDLKIAGSGDLDLQQIDVREIFVDIIGSGTVVLGGTSNQLDVNISGSGELKGAKLTTAVCKADVSGSGNITADVSQSLDANVSGSGDVFYTGNPEVKKDVSGSGDVKKM